MAYQSIHTGSDIDTGITNIQQIFDLIYPVGSYYISSDSANPSTKFGGTWEQIKDRMIMAAGNSYAVGATGGAASHVHTTAGHTLTVAEMPSHNHYVSSYVSGWEGWPKGDIGAYFLDYGKFENPNATVRNVNRGSSSNYQVANTGGGASHNHGDTSSATNLPPYIVAYIWRRTA